MSSQKKGRPEAGRLGGLSAPARGSPSSDFRGDDECEAVHAEESTDNTRVVEAKKALVSPESALGS